MVDWVAGVAGRTMRAFGSQALQLNPLARWVLNLLVVLNVLAQAVAVLMLILGRQAGRAAPVAAGAAASLFLLMLFYARWMLPIFRMREVLGVLLLKEVAVLALFALLGGVLHLAHLVLA